jgi:ATP-binding cassette, subfamily B, heavy metal transporter
VLENVSFSVEAGRSIGIVGASGAGKSTIARLLLRMGRAQEGRVLLDGMPIDRLPLRDLRRHVGLVPQETVLFDDTILNNIALGDSDCSSERVARAVRLAGLESLVRRLPEGLSTRIGEGGVRLSGGEKQRIGIARIVARDPGTIVFDEVTSSLDPLTAAEVRSNIRGACRNKTALIISHQLSQVQDLDEILVIEAGRIVERGTHSALLVADGVYAGLWNANEDRTERVCS